MPQYFDLNIEDVLDNWGVEHAIREIIANALDEQKLTDTAPIQITYKSYVCTIRDFGRGLEYKHFTQNESKEKHAVNYVIGKKGVGLKDALAVFHRNNIDVTIHSRYSTIRLDMINKRDFEVKTLHAIFDKPERPGIMGTEVVLNGVKKHAVDVAESMFLSLNQTSSPLEKNRYGEVYPKRVDLPGCIYVNGLKIAEEQNFLFSYNITKPSKSIIQAMDRDRISVSRTAYAGTIRNILKHCSSQNVTRTLVDDISKVMAGKNKDETGWVDISANAAIALNRSGTSVFMTPSERSRLDNHQIEILNNCGKELIFVTDAVFSKICSHVCTFENVVESYRHSFKYNFVPPEQLSQREAYVYSYSTQVFDFLQKKYAFQNPEVKISETIASDQNGQEAVGIWSPKYKAIIVKRALLDDLNDYLRVLFSVYTIYASSQKVVSREYETALSDILVFAYLEYLKKQWQDETVKDLQFQLKQLKAQNALLKNQLEELKKLQSQNQDMCKELDVLKIHYSEAEEKTASLIAEAGIVRKKNQHLSVRASQTSKALHAKNRSLKKALLNKKALSTINKGLCERLRNAEAALNQEKMPKSFHDKLRFLLRKEI